MKKFLFAALLSLISCSNNPASSDKESKEITGLWKSRDEHVDTPRSLVAIYEHNGLYYGRMLVTYGEDGKTVTDTIVEKKSHATGVVGHPSYCNIDFIYNLKKTSNGNYKGTIIDPQKGKKYDVEIWRSGKDLSVRGKVGIFGKTLKWHPGSEADLPKGFTMADIKKFVPIIPKTT